MSATWTIFAGTWRGVVLRRIRSLIFFASTSSSAVLRAGARTAPADVVVPILADHQAFHHFVELLDLAIDLGGADAYAAGIECGVRTP